MSQFDPQSFLDTVVTESNSTQATPIPEAEYTAVIEKVDVQPWQSNKDPSKSGLRLDVYYNIDDANGTIRDATGRDSPKCKQGILLDLTDSGHLDMGKGKNVGLGLLRTACGLNVPGTSFSFNQLPGHVVKVQVKHRIDGDNIYAEIRKVAAA